MSECLSAAWPLPLVLPPSPLVPWWTTFEEVSSVLPPSNRQRNQSRNGTGRSSRSKRGEILDALAAPLPAADLDGLRRRTRVLMGRCQGFYCGAEVRELLAGSR